MFKHIMTNSENVVISIAYLLQDIPSSGLVVSDEIPVELGWIYDPVAGTYSEPLPVVDDRPVYTIEDRVITANGQPVQFFSGNHYCQVNDEVQLVGNISDQNGDTVTGITVPVTLKMPLVRHANGQPTTDEIYLNVTLVAGVLTATGKIERSGDWKILIDRNNEALQRIGAQFKLAAADITFLA
jgi:hypothetical protein